MTIDAETLRKFASERMCPLVEVILQGEIPYEAFQGMLLFMCAIFLPLLGRILIERSYA